MGGRREEGSEGELVLSFGRRWSSAHQRRELTESTLSKFGVCLLSLAAD